MSGADLLRERFNIATCNGLKPTPWAAEGSACTFNDLFNGRVARENGAGQCIHKRRIGRFAEQRNAPTSLTLREQICAARSDALAMDAQVFTIPWGNPREADVVPKARFCRAWSVPLPDGMVAE